MHKQSDTGFTPWKTRFSSGRLPVRWVTDEVALEQVFLSSSFSHPNHHSTILPYSSNTGYILQNPRQLTIFQNNTNIFLVHFVILSACAAISSLNCHCMSTFHNSLCLLYICLFSKHTFLILIICPQLLPNIVIVTIIILK